MVDLLPHERQSTSPPDTTFRPQVSAGMFGGQVAQATEGLGTSINAVGRHWGEIVANDMVNQFQEAADKIIHGDPQKTVTLPDGTVQSDLGYLGTRGRAALDQRPLVDKKLDEITRQFAGKLYSADQKNLFQTATRRYLAISNGTMGWHADQQGVTYATGTADAQAKIAANSIARNANNPELVANSAAELIDARVKKAMILGAQPGDPQWTAARDLGRQEAVDAQASAIGINDPQRAMRIIENNKDVLGTKYDELANRFRARSEQGLGRDVADGLLSGTSPNENNIGNVRPRGSNTGFVQVKTFEDGVNLAVQNVRAYPKAFNGGKDMTLQQIGARWAPKGDGANDPNQWARNVAAGSGLPADKPIDLSDPEVAAKFARGVHLAEWGNKKVRPVEDYKAALSGGKGEPAQETPRSQADLIADVVSRNLPPQAEAAAIARINKSYALNEAVETKRKAEFKQQVDNSLAEALVTGSPSSPVPESDFIRHFGPENGAAKFADYQADVLYGAQRHEIESMSDSKMDNYLNAVAPQKGARNYARAIDRHGKLIKDVAGIKEARRNDPAGAVSTNGAVAAALQRYDEKNPESFKAVATARLQAQEDLGIEPEYRSPITKAEALKMTTPLRRLIPGDTAGALQAVREIGEKFQKMFGDQADEAFAYALRAQKVEAEVAQQAGTLIRKMAKGEPLRPADVAPVDEAQERAAADRAVRGFPTPTAPGRAPLRIIDNPVQQMTTEPSMLVDKMPTVPPAAIEFLLKNPATQQQFDAKYGTGRAKEIMKKFPVAPGLP